MFVGFNNLALGIRRWKSAAIRAVTRYQIRHSRSPVAVGERNRRNGQLSETRCPAAAQTGEMGMDVAMLRRRTYGIEGYAIRPDKTVGQMVFDEYRQRPRNRRAVNRLEQRLDIGLAQRAVLRKHGAESHNAYSGRTYAVRLKTLFNVCHRPENN